MASAWVNDDKRTFRLDDDDAQRRDDMRQHVVDRLLKATTITDEFRGIVRYMRSATR
jgi:hypothetical protein